MASVSAEFCEISVSAVFKGTTITLIILVLCLSYPHAHKSNLENFFPYHDSGVFAGAAVVSTLIKIAAKPPGLIGNNLDDLSTTALSKDAGSSSQPVWVWLYAERMVLLCRFSSPIMVRLLPIVSCMQLFGICVEMYHLPLRESHAYSALLLPCAGYNAACNMAEEVSHCPTL